MTIGLSDKEETMVWTKGRWAFVHKTKVTFIMWTKVPLTFVRTIKPPFSIDKGVQAIFSYKYSS